MSTPIPPHDNAEPQEEEVQQGQTFVSHLIELRSCLLRSILFILAVFLGLSYFANDIYALLAQPLIKHLPAGSTMIATEVASPFYAPFKLTLVAAVFLSMPYVFYQVWTFVAPGLYQLEQRFVWPLLVSSTILFYVGVAFAYFVVFPLMFAFFASAAPTGVAIMTDISRYLDFVLTIFFAFGVAFEVPVVTVLLIKTGITTRETLSNARPYIIVGAFIIGAVLTPPDVVSQTLLSVPIWLLYEVGMLITYRRKRKRQKGSNSTAVRTK
jgi:sec-independent protein translocase protein TatC